METKQTLKFLGIGSAFNKDEHNTCAYLKSEDRTKLFLFDCGSDAFKMLMIYGVLDDVTDVNVFITHTHTDHIGSLGTLIEYCHHVLKIKPKVYYKKMYILSTILHNMNIKYDMYEYINDATYTGEDFEIKPVEVDHSPYINCYGYTITDYNRNIYYSGDCNSVSKEIDIESFDEIYHDLTDHDFKPVDPHCNITKFVISVPKRILPKVYGMHISNDEDKEKILAYGMKIPRTIIEERGDL